jgi:transcriptional regulator of aromatic amino acid metabolism
VGGNKTRKVKYASSPQPALRWKNGFRRGCSVRSFLSLVCVSHPRPLSAERRQDIGLLAGHFLEKFAAEQHKKVNAFSAQVLEFIKTKPWPGNIRELENFIER